MCIPTLRCAVSLPAQSQQRWVRRAEPRYLARSLEGKLPTPHPLPHPPTHPPTHPLRTGPCFRLSAAQVVGLDFPPEPVFASHHIPTPQADRVDAVPRSQLPRSALEYVVEEGVRERVAVHLRGCPLRSRGAGLCCRTTAPLGSCGIVGRCFCVPLLSRRCAPV